MRLRPSFFPFTEPSAEVDVTCRTAAARLPDLLGHRLDGDPRRRHGRPAGARSCGIDPAVYSGFAFGLGLDRVAMNRYGIPNIRILFDNDERLLRQVAV